MLSIVIYEINIKVLPFCDVTMVVFVRIREDMHCYHVERTVWHLGMLLSAVLV